MEYHGTTWEENKKKIEFFYSFQFCYTHKISNIFKFHDISRTNPQNKNSKKFHPMEQPRAIEKKILLTS